MDTLEKLSSPVPWHPLTDEEKTRYEALFFSQGPIEGLLPGEKARELFLLSKLSLQILSKIWNMVDISHDNMLDSTEFGNAIHLIQQNLCGHSIPSELPECLSGDEHSKETRVPYMNTSEYGAYRGLYQSVKKDVKGFVSAPVVKDTLLTSRLPLADLAHVWNLADANRDGKLDLEEFTVACHLTRFYKKGKKITGPVNVQSILPHKLPKTDLVGKRKKLSLLEKKKNQLMALREQRKLQASRESKRVELWRQRLKILTSMHHILTEDPEIQLTNEALSEETLNREQKQIKELQAVADRLKKEDERVRKATTKVIIEEQKLSKEVKSLEEEAEKFRKRRQRNSLIKDLDPFHQLYEERKEEKLSGVAPSSKSEEYKIEIPTGQDPFDIEKIKDPPFSGEELFSVHNNNVENPPSSGTTNSNKEISSDLSWDKGELNPKMMELTRGFEDNFVEFWTEKTSEANKTESSHGNEDSLLGEIVSPGLRELDSEFTFDDQVDAVFKTISVTAEEDDLWSSLPSTDNVLSPQKQDDFTTLQSQLSNVKDQMKDLQLEGPQIVFNSPQSYTEEHDKVESLTAPAGSTSLEGLLKERRKYKSVEKEDSNPRNIHSVERRKKRISADPSLKTSINSNFQSVDTENYNPESLNLELDLFKDDFAENYNKNVTSETISFQDNSENLFDPFRVDSRTEEFDNLYQDPFSSSLLQIKQDIPEAKQNTELGIGNNVQKRSGISTDRSERSEKAKTWCVGDQNPVAPPRKKSPKKSINQSENIKDTPPIPSRSRSSDKTHSPCRSPESSVESSPSPRRPPRKGSPSKKKKTPSVLSAEEKASFQDLSTSNFTTPQSSGPTSPVLVLTAAGKEQYSSIEGETSSESSPIAPPRPKRGSTRHKSPPPGALIDSGSHSRSTSEDFDTFPDKDIANNDAEKREQTSSNYENVDFKTSKPSEFSKEIEALFDEVASGSFSENKSQGVLKENIVTQNIEKDPKPLFGKATTSDYCSQSDGSLIDDDMEAAARKQELEKLRDLYFGDKSPKQGSSETNLDINPHSSQIERSSAAITLEEFNSVNANSPSDTRSESESKRDSGCFLEDVFSSVNFEVDPFQARPAQAPEPTKISLDLDAYQSEFVSTLNTSGNNKDPFFTSSQDVVNNEKSVNSVFSEGYPGNEKFSNGNGVLIGTEHDGVMQRPPQNSDSNNFVDTNDGNDSDVSDNAVHFKAEFDPFASTTESVVFESPKDTDVTLISYQSTADKSSVNTYHNENRLKDKENTGEHLIADRKQDNYDILLNFGSNNAEKNDWDFNSMNNTSEMPPPLPSEPPPPLPTSPPPNLNSLRSALKQDPNDLLLGFSSEPLSNVNNDTLTGKEIGGDGEDNNMPHIPLAEIGGQPSNVRIQVSMNDNSSQVLKAQGIINHCNNNREQEKLNDTTDSDTYDIKKDNFNFESGSNKTDDFGVNNSGYGRSTGESNGNVGNIKSTVVFDDQDNNSEPPGQNSNTAVQNTGMDPVTGLRRTNISDPVEKALKFVQDTEPSFRVKKKIHNPEEEEAFSHLTGFKTRAQEIQEERQEILDSMKIKKKNFENWYPDSDQQVVDNNNYYYAIEDHGVDFEKSAESEKKYEERKKKLQERMKEDHERSATSPTRVTTREEIHEVSRPLNNNLMNTHNYSITTTTTMPERTTNYNSYDQADIDSTSLTEQKQKTKQHWEEKFSSPDVKLFPGQVKGSQQVKVKTVVKSSSYVKKPNNHESAIEREIRLAQEREEELRQEKEFRLQEVHAASDNRESDKLNMPIHKVPLASPTSPVAKSMTTTISVETKSAPPKYSGKNVQSEMLSPQSYRELTEVDRDSVPKQESIIEREIREQIQREEAVRQEIGKQKHTGMGSQNKEAEQSEYERKEKELERINAHESVIDREIRLQRERDQEVQRLRALARGEPSQPYVNQTVVITRTSEPVEKPVKLSRPGYTAVTHQSHYSSSSPASANTSVHLSQDIDMSRDYNPHSGTIGNDITYSDAIAGSQHGGESLIAKELREQREREEELRQHWESLGFSVPENARDPPDTPYNMPEPRQPPPIKTSRSVPGSLSSNTSQRFLPTYQKEMKHSTSADIRYLNANSGANSSNKTGRRPSTDSASSRSTEHSQHGETQQANKSKVQPYRGDSEDEEDSETMYRFVPLTETPVEREIRLAKEREEALRKEKGLPAVSNDRESQSDVMLEVRGSNSGRHTHMNYRKGVSEDDRGTMKRFASSRLQLEIQKEKQREVDLKSVGKINTLSEERVGPSTKYIDIITKDEGPPPMPKTPTTPKQYVRSSSTRTTDYPDYASPTPVQNGSVSSGSIPATPTEAPKTETVIVRRYTSDQKQKVAPGTESMIERELREMKEREEELRAQRERATGKPIPVSEDYYTQQEVQFRQNGTMDNTQKSNRRKSALAEEWEKKFGAAS